MKLSIFLLLVLLIACSPPQTAEQDPATGSEDDSETLVEEKVTQKTPVPFNHGAIFSGELGNKYPIRLRIENSYDKTSKYVNAHYHYKGITTAIPLLGAKNGDNLNLSYDRKGELSESFEGKLQHDGIYKGMWRKGDKTLPFELTPECFIENQSPSNFEELLSNFTKLELPIISEQFTSAPDPGYKAHLIAAGMIGCKGDPESFSKFKLLKEKENRACYYGSYFVNKSGNYVLLYVVSDKMPTLQVAMFDSNGQFLNRDEIGFVFTSNMIFENFAFEIDENQQFHRHTANYYRETGNEELVKNRDTIDLSTDGRNLGFFPKK